MAYREEAVRITNPLASRERQRPECCTNSDRLRSRLALCSTLLCALLFFSPASAGPLDEMSLDRWAKLREVERYQLNIAEKYYRELKWKVAADEYEKFLKLYEKSEGAPYAQLKWSHCMVQLRKQNTAIKEGYQTLIDYYPDSPDAISAAYLIGKTYKEAGDLIEAKKAYAKVMKTHPNHVVSIFTRLDLVEIAGKENDTERRVVFLKQLTFDVQRNAETSPICLQAAQQLAHHYFSAGDLGEGLKALETSYKPDTLPVQMMKPNIGRLPLIVAELVGSTDEMVKKRGVKLADEAVIYLRTQVKADLAEAERKAQAMQSWYFIADIQLAAGRPEKQREVYEEMLKSLGTDDNLLGHLAKWHKANNQRDLARATYLKYKDRIEGQRQTAVSWSEEKKFDTAIEIYRRLALEDAANAPKWLGDAASTYRRASKPDQAIAIYRELLVSDAKSAAAHHWEIAETLRIAQRWKEALTTYRGTDNFPQNYLHMATCNRALKQYDEAITLYRQIMAAHAPSASSALLEIARTEAQAGRKEAAIKTYKQVCDRYPKTPDGSTAHATLNKDYGINVTLGGAKD